MKEQSRPQFTHLHCASAFSMRYGVAFPESIVERAAELDMQRIALVDRDGLYGAVRFALACTAAGIGPILGVDLPLLEPVLKSRTPAAGGAVVDQRPSRVVLLARGKRGVVGLNRLVSARHELGGISREILRQVVQLTSSNHEGGLTLLLGPDSDVGRAVAARKPAVARALLAEWQETGVEVRIELVSHRARVSESTLLPERGLPLNTPAAARMWQLAISAGVEVVLTNAARYLEPRQGRVVDVLDASRRLTLLSGRETDRANGEGYLKSSEQMWQIAQEIATAAALGSSEVEGLWRSTFELGVRAELEPGLDLGIGSVHVPELDVILGKQPPLSDAAWDRPMAKSRSASEVKREAVQADAVLRERCYSALPVRSSVDPQFARERLEEELAVISQLGFGSYFLTVAEVARLARELEVRTAARGSGAGSFVNYLLGISMLNPLEHGLIMERFLSPLRSSLPDIDIDVESHRRLDVYEAVIERFGADRVACVSMMETYRVRHAIRDVGGALGLPPSEVDALAKSFPHIRARDARSALAELPELRRSGLGALARNGALDQLLDLVEGLDGLPRQVALHPCGVLLSDSALLDRTPVQTSAGGFPMSQFDKDDVETLGLLKLDILGIRMQSAMSHAVAEISRVEGVEVQLDELPLDDPATYELISSTRTLGCFQIESPGQRELVGKFAPSTFNDIIIDISLFRPGPVKSDMVTPFLQARQGWKPARYPHPNLRGVLQETYGVVVFHEQVIGLVAELTGCTLAEADEVRRGLGDWDRLPQLRAWFYPEALRRGYDLDVVEEVWEVLRAFASFGFCKAHAGAFALPTYQSAWLKAHHPAAFYAGVLTHDPGMYPRRLILADAKAHGVPVLGLDINESCAEYVAEETQEGLGIRIPLSAVKGISEEEVNSILLAQPFNSINDVWQRTCVSRPVLERLVLTGAFDRLHGIDVRRSRRGALTRRDLLVHVCDLERSNSRSVEVEELLFVDDLPQQPLVTGLPEVSANDRLAYELEILELDVSEHVIAAYEPLLDALGVARSRNLLQSRSKSEVWIAGVKVATQTPPVRSGRRVVFLTLDDSTGPVDATFFEDAQALYSRTLFSSWLLLVRGVVRRTGPKGVSIRATGCWDLQIAQQIFEEAGGARNPDAARQVLAALAELDAAVAEEIHDYDEQEVAEQAESRAVRPVMSRPNGSALTARRPGSKAGGMGGGRQRVLVHPSGFRMSPWADIKPAGPPGKLWHTSPGSPG